MVFGKVINQHCYKDGQGNINTINTISVDAWIKNGQRANELYVITVGGVLGNQAQVSFPAIQLQKGQRYFLMLEGNNLLLDDKTLRSTDPAKPQAFPYADAQGAWQYREGKFHDAFNGSPLTEKDLIDRLGEKGYKAVKPDGTAYIAREEAGRTGQTNDVTSFSPNPTDAGTIDANDFLTINGSGFGSSPGTVQFPNADNGGSTFIFPPNTTDYVSWTDNQIVVKVPTGSSTNAGSGNFLVNGVFSSPQPLTVRYSHISINSDFSGFPSATRQRYYLRNMDGLGGYVFSYNTNFTLNVPATAAFERALNTWRCSTGINWRTGGTTASGYADDNENVVFFDGSLPAGVLARATSRFSGSATGSCNLFNTVWWLEEIDVQVKSTGVTWQYGPALATGAQFDFETVVLHELGHAHGLGHRIAPGQLMHYTIANASNVRIPAEEEKQGGRDKIAYSTTPTCFNPSGSGTPMVASSLVGCTLPLTLVSFSGEAKRYGGELKWKTQNEVNTDRFEIQRSSNGADFTTIGIVRAGGNSSIEHTYAYVDGSMKPGLNYYRLKMIDKDGKLDYSATILLRLNAALASLVIYPNPVKSELQLTSTARSTLRLIDINGKLILVINVEPGLNKININNISDGFYYLRDELNGTTARLVISRK
ncbi:MAG: hypothetical protein K0Q66_439 [Chitinophagaceae bacterium]|nr:hypothetical protein [Chitinophagaceae bacterium]